MKIGDRLKRRRSGNNPVHSLREQRNMLCDKMGFTAAEAYKMLRANLMFALPNENKCRVIGVTSSLRGEGKSTNAINIAYTLAETGKEVLLIDADMRLPSVSKKLALNQTPGLSNVVAGLCEAEDALQIPMRMNNWKVMAAGDIPPNPSELLSSEQMYAVLNHLAERFEFIVVDLPPVNIVSDALAVSKWIDGLVVVVRQNYVDRKSLAACMNQLAVLQSKVLGFVMTDVAEKSKEYGHKYGKYYKHGYGYGYGYGDADAAKKDNEKNGKKA